MADRLAVLASASPITALNVLEELYQQDRRTGGSSSNARKDVNVVMSYAHTTNMC